MRFSSSVVILAVQEIITTGIQLVLSIYVARSIGPQQLGILVLMLAMAQYGDKLGRMRFDEASIYLFGQKKAGLSKLKRHIFWLSLPQILATLFILFLAKKWILDVFFGASVIFDHWYFLALAHIPLISLLMNHRKLALASKAVRLYTRTTWSIPAIQLAFLLTLGFLLGIGSLNAGWVLTASLLAHALVLMYSQRVLAKLDLEMKAPPEIPKGNFWRGSAFNLDPALVKELTRLGPRYYLISLPQFLQLRLDVFLIAYFLTPKEVAFYSLATTASELLWKLPNAMQMILFPQTASLSQTDARQFTINVFRHSVLIMFFLALASALAIYPAVSILYGENFLPTVFIFLLLLPGTVAMGLAKTLFSYFFGQGVFKVVFMTTACAVGLNLVLNIVLIPKYFTLGAAAASSLTYGGTFLALAIYFLRITRRQWGSLVPNKEDLSFYPARAREIFIR